MLYLTTRDRADSFTAHRVLKENRAFDGGMFIPIQLPIFQEDDIRRLCDMSFGDAVAHVLNLFFDKGISGWDIEFCVGRSPFQLSIMNHRLLVVQLWHNHGADYHYLERSLYDKLCGSNPAGNDVPEWPRIGIRIAVLFGIYAELLRNGYSNFDIAVPSGDFRLPVALWYAGNMGLPLRMIIYGCNADSGIWDLIHRGEFSTGAVEPDVLCGVERLVFDVFGREEVKRYLNACQRRGVYKLAEEQQWMLRRRISAVVVSDQRVDTIIKSVYRSNQYVLDARTALAYGALQDYRAKSGESRATLILADKSPALSVSSICKILGISSDTLKKTLNG